MEPIAHNHSGPLISPLSVCLLLSDTCWYGARRSVQINLIVAVRLDRASGSRDAQGVADNAGIGNIRNRSGTWLKSGTIGDDRSIPDNRSCVT